jgi:tetratricopeptide (TPR) repeat protein
MKRILLIWTIITFTFSNSFACLNGASKILKNGEILYADHDSNVPWGHDFNIERTRVVIREVDSLYKATKDIDYLSDKALLLIILKEYNQAIKIYLEIEKKKPGRYETASNIGTAYELIGDNENALKWITKAIQIDTNSHHGSEWIHANILKTKIGGDKLINSLSLLNKGFGEDSVPKSTLSKNELGNLYVHLFYQLNERMSFVKPKDKIVAQLLFDLGNIAYLNNYYKDAIEDYELASKYGYDQKEVNKRIAIANNAIHERSIDLKNQLVVAMTPKKPNYLLYIVIGLSAILVLGGIVYFAKRKNYR